ncbi:MAG: class I SAM-dependent methyltransferase [Verrucomicrobia bacterium]|nr:class I SAM-dependent methyltransferase [Verrucomicrobiota bacterium]
MELATDVAHVWEPFSHEYTERVFCPTQFGRIRAHIRVHIRKPDVLDLGCGPTAFLLRELAADLDINPVASDFSEGMLQTVKSKLRASDGDLALRVNFHKTDNRDLVFDGDRFDTVVSVNSILPEKRQDIAPMISEVFRILKPSGRLVAILPAFETTLMAKSAWDLDVEMDEANHREKDTTGWQCFFTKEDIGELLSDNGFQCLTIQKLEFTFEEEINAVSAIYGIAPELLRRTPLFEHFVTAEKPHS